MQTTQAPSQELHTPNPTALYPVSLLLLKLMHTVIALFPTHHCLLMMEWVQCLLSLPLPHPCLLLLMPPWRIMIHPHWTRKFQMDSRRTWIETMTNQRAIKPSQLCKKYSNLSLDMVMASATVVLVSILDFWILFFSFFSAEEDKLEKSEVQAIIESTPELDMDLGSCRGTRYNTED